MLFKLKGCDKMIELEENSLKLSELSERLQKVDDSL